MPELPEVETIVRGLARRVTGDAIESVWLGEKPEPLKSPAQEIVATLDQTSIAGVRRVGKHIVFDLSRQTTVVSRKQKKNRQSPVGSRKRNASVQSQFIVHLGMTGQLLVTRPEATVSSRRSRQQIGAKRAQSAEEARDYSRQPCPPVAS